MFEEEEKLTERSSGKEGWAKKRDGATDEEKEAVTGSH